MASKNSDSGETEEDFSFLNIAKTNPAVIKDKVLQKRLESLQGRAEPPKKEVFEKIDVEKLVQERAAKIRGTSKERFEREQIFEELRRYNRESAERRAKRGRTEITSPITSPPERPPTPGEARLGDWMRKIEEYIKEQASEIKNLKASVDQLREALQAKVVEVTEIVQHSETKIGASVLELRETFDGQIQAAAESIGKQVDAKVEVARADSVRSLVSQAKKIEEIRENFDKQIREAVKQVVEKESVVLEKTKFKKSVANGIFFTGLDVIAKREKMQGDITAVVHNILHKVGSAPYYTDVIAVHPKTSPRSSAKNAIIYFQSVYHKNHAAAQIRMMLFREKYVKIGIRDLFNPADVPRSKDLTAKGFELKRRDVISKFRVSNLEDTPVMLVAKRGGAYEKVTDVQVEEMLKRTS